MSNRTRILVMIVLPLVLTGVVLQSEFFFSRENVVRAYPPMPMERVVTFPTTKSRTRRGMAPGIGTLFTRPWEEGPLPRAAMWDELGRAAGSTRIPAENVLMLVADGSVQKFSCLGDLDPYGLQVLTLPGKNRFTHASMRFVGKLVGLRVLRLPGARITDECLADLFNLTYLEHLDLQNCPIYDEAVPYLARLTSLRTLWLFRTRMSQEGAAELRKQLPDCDIRF